MISSLKRKLSTQCPALPAQANTDAPVCRVKPSHYELSLYDLEFGGAWSYQGIVKIHLQIHHSTKEIVLNTHELNIHEAELRTEQAKSGESTKAKNITYNAASHQTFFHFPSAIAPSAQAVLTIRFSGTMNNVMAGFYRSKYKPSAPAIASVPRDDEYHYMFSTQFESCDARRAFPCFDEPNLKATFDIEIEIPDDQTALSNMPEKQIRKGGKAGTKIVAFEKTPVMSTYLVAWAFGDFEYVETFTKRSYNGQALPVRVYTTKGLKQQGQFALDNAHTVIDMFSEVFDIDYPLPKYDLLAVHEFSHGAMENWGLITYRTTAVLFDEANSDQKYKNRVAYVVAHETAHQHFGNLVTMDWWNELWLNEGFATWSGWWMVSQIYPSWNVFGQFVTEGMQTAFNLDALRTSHPIEVAVKDALEVDQIFDSISYLKGSSVIRMLSAHLGVDTFLRGVSNYLKAHAYGNARTVDLWSALSEASGKDVNAFADNWIRTIGFPILTIAEEPGQVSVRQSRFLSTGDVAETEDQTIWWIPLGLTTGTQKPNQESLALTTKEKTIRDIDDDFYKFNTNQTGFFRCNYPPARLIKLGAQKDRLSVEDRIGLVADAAALAVAGYGTTAAVLGLVEQFQDEQNYLVWSQIISTIAGIRSVFADHPTISQMLQKFTLKLISPITEKVGWEFPANEDFLSVQLRSMLITAAGLAGHESIAAEAKRLFGLQVSGKDNKAIHPNLRAAVYRIVITEGGDAEYEQVKQQFLTTASVDGKEIALLSMGCVQTPELARDYFTFLMSDQVAVQDVHSGAASLSANGKSRMTQWDCIKENWNTVYRKLAGNPVVLDRYLRLSLTKFANGDAGKDIADFFQGKDNRGYDRSLGVISDTITGNANYRIRDEALILQWLDAHGYA